jgi:hypothetical protein
LRLIRKSGQSGRLEPLDARGAVARAAVEVFVGDASRVEPRLTSAEQLVNCEKTSALCPSSIDLAQLRQEQHVELGARVARRAVGSIRPGWQAAWRRRSSASRIWIFDRDRPSRSTRASSALAVVGAQLVVERALLALELAVERLLGLRRQLGRDLLLGAPQDERPQGRASSAGFVARPARRGRRRTP